MPDYLFALVAILLVFILPGSSLTRVFNLKMMNFAESLFYSISLSFAIVVFIGFVLGNTIGISFATVLIVFFVASLLALSIAGRLINRIIQGRVDLLNGLGSLSKKIDQRFVFGVLAVACITAFNWIPAIGTHAIDMGEHVFWAKTIIATGRLPNYLSVEPLDQAVKFTYGAHLILAQFFLLAGIPIEDYTWIPTVIGSMAILLGVVLITFRITSSKWAALVAALLYASAAQPFGFIERGNLPDISGYLLLVSTLYSVIRVRSHSSFAFPLGLTAVSVIPSHQLATVILPFSLFFAIMYSYARSRPELKETIRSIFHGRVHQMYWTSMILVAIVYSATTTYVSSSAASQLVTGNWRPYVPAAYNDLLVPGVTLGLLGLGGAIVTLRRKTIGIMVLLGWTTSLIFLTNALLIGIPIPDPLRFLWRLTEPLTILGAMFVYLVINKLRASRRTQDESRGEWFRRKWVLLSGTSLVILIIAVQITALAVPALEGTPNVFSLPPRYLPVESFYQDDKQIGLWLASNAPVTTVTTNDADVDSTATWVQVYSMRLHFLYRADFAAIVAPANYIKIYKGMAILYESPNDLRVPMIIHDYNITYVIAHTDEITLFDSASCFGHAPVFQSGGSALFATTSC